MISELLMRSIQSLKRPRQRWAAIAAVAVAIVAVWIVLRQGKATAAAGPSAPPFVPVVKVDREDLWLQVTNTAEFRPYYEVELHAKVSGYLQHINVDFGDKVKAGQPLATLEVPELMDQLTNAIATEEKAEADHTNADLIYTRLVSVRTQRPGVVAQQDVDTALANATTTAAAIAAAKADVEKYRTLVDYTRITAPFDGVITKRYADPGALIQTGIASDIQSMPLVRISDNYLLRMDFPVDLDYVPEIRVGDPVDVCVQSLGDKKFTTRITRFTNKVEEDTRKMTVEGEVPNPNLELKPGMYAIVTLRIHQRPGVLAVPIETVSMGENPSVLVVNSNHEVEKRPIVLGLETPTRFEVLSGLKEGELVMVGNPTHVAPGQKVETKFADLADAQ